MPRLKRSRALSLPCASNASKRAAGSMPFTVSWDGTPCRGACSTFSVSTRRHFPMSRMLRFAALALTAWLAALGAHAKEREISVGLQAAITSIDPHYHNLSPNNSLLRHIYEPLIWRDA